MSAVFSDCGRYRYRLDGEIPADLLADLTETRALFVMLNPSKAGRVVNGVEATDPTRTRVANFTAAWGYARFSIVNLCAHVATDPKELLALDYAEAVGPDNDRHITEAAGEASLIVAAWGASYPKALTPRIREVVRLLAAAAPHLPVHHLGLTKNGDPRHPLFVLGTTKPTRWAA